MKKLTLIFITAMLLSISVNANAELYICSNWLEGESWVSDQNEGVREVRKPNGLLYYEFSGEVNCTNVSVLQYAFLAF